MKMSKLTLPCLRSLHCRIGLKVATREQSALTIQPVITGAIRFLEAIYRSPDAGTYPSDSWDLCTQRPKQTLTSLTLYGGFHQALWARYITCAELRSTIDRA